MESLPVFYFPRLIYDQNSMKNYKLLTILQQLGAGEMRLLARFIRSPIYNRHEDVIRLFDYLRGQLRKSISSIDEEKVFLHLFPDEDSVDLQKLHYVNSYLLKAVEKFLAWNEWQKDPSEHYLSLLQAYRHYKLEKPLQQSLQKIRQIQEKSALRDDEYHYLQYSIQMEEYRYRESLGRIREFNLQELANSQDIAYISGKLKNACVLLSHQAVSKTSYDTGLLSAVLTFLSDHPYRDIPAIGVYYYGYLALSDIEDGQAFQKLKTLVKAHEHKFSREERKDIYLLAINCCIRRLNAMQLEYFKEVFELYQMGLETEVFLENGQLSPWTYSNIIASGLRLKEYKWVEAFLEEYKQRLPVRHREGFFHYNRAKFFFEKGDYDRAMPLLVQMEYDDLLHNLSARTMLARMYYELQEVDSLEHLLASFRVYIRRKKGLGYHKQNYLNFIHFLNRLIRIPPDGKKEYKGKLEEEIRHTPGLTEKAWLLGQLEKA
jgi:hypothetical protein